MFRFEKADRGGVVVLALFGGLDAMVAPALKAEVVAISELKTMKIVVDVTALTLIDSTGVGVLISLFKRTRAQGGHVYFAGLAGQPKEVFRLLRLERSLDLHPTVDEAVARLQAAVG
jgi:anti-sigma B factor antagonist